MAFAFLTGAGVGATAILVAKQVQKSVAPNADQLLKKCSRAAERLDSQIQTAS